MKQTSEWLVYVAKQHGKLNKVLLPKWKQRHVYSNNEIDTEGLMATKSIRAFKMCGEIEPG